MEGNRKDLYDKLMNIYNIDIQEIKDLSDDFISISLEEIRQELLKLRNLIPKGMIEKIINLMTDNEVNNALNSAIQLNKDFEQIKRFSPRTQNIQQQVEHFIKQIRNSVNTLIAILGAKKVILSDEYVEQRFNQLSLSIDKKFKNIDAYESEIENRKKQFDELLAQLQEIASKESVEKYSRLFDTEASKYKYIGIAFGILSISVLLAVIYLGVILYEDFIAKVNDASMTTSKLIVGNLPRIFILSISIYVLFNFVKLFNINMHLYVLNKHRHNALRTFKTFIESVDDKLVKEQLTLTVAKYIFDMHSTGYIKSSKSGSSDSNIVLSFIDKGMKQISREDKA